MVYLFPDLRSAGDAQYAREGPPRDTVIRQFYVGATRARETPVHLPRETDGMAVSICEPRPVDLTKVPAVPWAWVDEHVYAAIRGVQREGAADTNGG